ncbi:MAG: YcaO-like family protein [Hydrococcus sp. CSU_1_8]|nr:YcaO-like family protein [Hydrococcus sp. CSU_1_8]
MSASEMAAQEQTIIGSYPAHQCRNGVAAGTCLEEALLQAAYASLDA